MEDKDKLESLRFISELHRKLHHQRRTIELRILLTTLSLYALAAFAVLKGEFKHDPNESIIIAVWICFILVACLASAYLLRVHNANRINLTLSEAAEKEISNVLDLNGLKKAFEDAKDYRPRPFLTLIWQTAIIFSMGIGSALIISFSW